MIYQRKTKRALWTTLPKAKVTLPKVRHSVRRRSKLRAAQYRIYIPEMLAFLRTYPKCMRCGQKTTCLPHYSGRCGKQLLIKRHWRSSCFSCNDFAKNNPAGARRERWIAPIGKYAV